MGGASHRWRGALCLLLPTVEFMNRIITKKRIKYFLILIILIGISVGSYYLYKYYKYQFVDPAVVFVHFKPEITEEEAFKMLERYVPGISARTPRYYDNPSFDFLEGFEGKTIQFTVKGAYRWNSIKEQIKKEPIVRF